MLPKLSFQLRLPAVLTSLARPPRSDAGWIEQFDRIDMTASTQTDKLAAHGLTLLPSEKINAPGIAEAAVVLEW